MAKAEPARRQRGADAVAQALQRYADRGVFRGFSVRRAPIGRQEYRFTWMVPQPIALAYEPRSAALTFKALLPAIGRDATLSRELRAVVKDHAGRAVPAHRRIDQRRARVTCWVRGGDFSIALTVRGSHHEYAVQKGLNLVNALFVLLHSTYPDYLVKHFGVAEE